MAAVKTVYRSEHDSIGERSVPKDVYYGVQSLRAAGKLSHHGADHAPGDHQLHCRDQKGIGYH